MICLLTSKYGLTKGSEHQLICKTPLGNHYLIISSKHHMHKHHKDVYWSWVTKGPVPVDESCSSGSTSSNSSTSSGKRKLGETKSKDLLKTKAQQLGACLMLITDLHPSEFGDIIQLMDTLEARQAPEIEASSSLSASSISSPQPTVTNDCGPTDWCQEEARSSTATEAGSISISEPTADQISHQDQSWQAYTAQWDCVFSCLGTE